MQGFNPPCRQRLGSIASSSRTERITLHPISTKTRPTEKTHPTHPDLQGCAVKGTNSWLSKRDPHHIPPWLGFVDRMTNKAEQLFTRHSDPLEQGWWLRGNTADPATEHTPAHTSGGASLQKQRLVRAWRAAPREKSRKTPHEHRAHLPWQQ